MVVLRRQSIAINDHHFRWKLLKSNFQELFLIMANWQIILLFLVTLNNFVLELSMHHTVRVCTGKRTDRQTECINTFQLF